jgi:elongation factor Ts
MAIDTQSIQALREETGAGLMDAKRALQEAGGDHAKAIEVLRKHGQKIAAKKQGRQTNEGLIGTYVHANHKVVSLVALACETDFVAKTEDFIELAHELAMQVAATDPQYIIPADVPAAMVAKEKEIYREQLKSEGKPEKMWDKISEGKLEKFFSEVCLLKQTFIKDDKKTVELLIQEKILKLGENIQIKEIKRMAL